jgi:hypothetical protein
LTLEIGNGVQDQYVAERRGLGVLAADGVIA